MSRHAFASLLTVTGVMAATVASAAPATQAEYETAYASAAAAEHEAEILKQRWSPTEDALSTAKKLADQQKYDEALAMARRAETLAKISVQQNKEESAAWRDAVIK